MTNNQQLAAHCRDVIANPQDHLDWVVDMARVALASVEAEPVAWVSKSELALIRPAKNRCVESTLWGVQRFDEVPIFTAQPASVLKVPVAYDDGLDLDDGNFDAGAQWMMAQIMRLNGEES